MEWLTRWMGEFTVIVVGVLVALGVDDWRQGQADRQLEEHLLGRLVADLRADDADLALARLGVQRRIWVFEALLSDLEDGVADGRPEVPLPDSLVVPTSTIALLEAAGRGGGTITETWNPVEAPLTTFRLYPEFDLADDSFQEMLAGGGLRVLRDPALRSAILEYYRVAADMGENERREASYELRLEEAFARTGVVLSDELTLLDLARHIAARPELQVELRRSLRGLGRQAMFLGFIDGARERLEASLADSRAAAS